MSQQKLSNELILLLLLYVDKKSKIVGKTRLQKIVFLYEKEYQNKLNKPREMNLFDYFAHHYGPFSSNLYRHIERLKVTSMINVKNEVNCGNSTSIDQETEYSIAELGLKILEEEVFSKNIMNDLEINILCEFKKEYNNMNLTKLIQLVYERYPEYAKNSKIKDKIGV